MMGGRVAARRLIPMPFLLVFLIAGLVSLAGTPIVIRLARRGGFVYPGGRPQDIHAGPVPRLGGLALYVAFCAAVGAGWLLPRVPGEGWSALLVVPRLDPAEPGRLLGLLLGATLILVLGIADDRRPLSPGVQLAGQVIAAVVAIAAGVSITAIANPLGGMLVFPTGLAVLFSLFWIVGATNTINWIDGLDGLAAGVSAIAALAFAAHSLNLGQQSVALLPVALAGAALGFLPYNFYPARIFLGGGAYLLGYLLACLAIIGGTKGATLLLVLGLPILDVAWQIVRRLRAGQNPALGDQGHLHQRLFRLGLSQPRVVSLYYTLSAGLGLLAIGLPTGQLKLLALALISALTLLLLAWIARQ